MRSVLALSLLALASPRPADACSPPPCWHGSFLPANGTIPANAPALLWRPTQGQNPVDVKLTNVGTGAKIAVEIVDDPAGKALVPVHPLVPGTTYRLAETTACDTAAPISVTFTAGPAAPLPTSVGTTKLESATHGDITISTARGSCTVTVEAERATFTLEHSADVTPWKDLLIYQTIVDDRLWVAGGSINETIDVGGSWRGRGRDEVYRVCVDNQGEGRGLDEGAHRIAFHARLPGTTTDLAASTATIDTSCARAPSPPSDPGSTRSDSRDPSKPSTSGGCCSASATTSSNVVWITLVGVLLMRRRRRG